MVTWQDFAISFVQTAMVTPDHSAFVSGRVVATIMREFGDRFSGVMQVLPIPQGAPPEIPVVVLTTGDKSQSLSAGPAQFICTWSRIGSNAILTFDQAVHQCLEVLEYYVRDTRVRVGRLSLVVQRTCPSENPAQTLIQRFCTEESQREPFNRSASFEIHNHKHYKPVYDGVDYQINSWVRCRSRLVGPDRSPAIVVAQDLNTIAGETSQHQFDADKVRVFFAMASHEAEAIIQKYFPRRE